MPSYTFSSPPFSFMDVQNPSDSNCGQNDYPCIPVMFLQEMQFQVFCETDDLDFESLTIIASVDVACGESGINKPVNYQGFPSKVSGYGEPLKYVVLFGFNSADVFADYPVGTCFVISIYFQEGDNFEYQYCFSQCFTKIASGDECYTTIYAYRNPGNAFGFIYNNPDFTNIIRLPTYLHSPVNVEEQKSYAKSNGSTKKIMHRVWKDFKVKTDYFPAGWLEKFAIATAHSEVFVVDSYGGVNELVVRTEKVEIDWKEEDMPIFKLAQASTVLRLAAPRETLNTNCSNG